MARHESQREDLLREATALVERAEFTVPPFQEPVVAGFRRDGSASFFFGEQLVYQFNGAGELRRAFANGLLYKAEQGSLVELRRERTEHETALLRRELSEAERAAFLSAAEGHLTQLHESLAAGQVTVIGQVPKTADVIQRIREWLETRSSPLKIAQAPNVR
jgi:hypothetical protein